MATKEKRKKTTTFIFLPFLLGIGATVAYFIWGRKPKPNTATFYGTVTDLQTGGVLPNVRVSVDSLFKYTSSSGNYLFENLDPGTYTVLFEIDGYESVEGEVDLIIGENILNVALSPIVWEMPEYELHYVEEWTHYGEVSDWDFFPLYREVQPGYWELDTQNFISPPSSLTLAVPSYEWEPAGVMLAIYNAPESRDLKQGRIVSWVFGSTTIFPWPDYVEGFVYGFKNTDDFRVVEWEMYSTWTKYRLTWWNDFDLQNQPKLHVLLEYWDDAAGKWSTAQEFQEERRAGSINRIGLYFKNYYSGPGGGEANFDNTEIWVVKGA